MRSSVSIALFFLLSGFFLFALLAAIEHSRKAAAIASACLVTVVCIIVFVTPVRLPDWMPGNHREDPAPTTTTTTAVAPTDATGGGDSDTGGAMTTTGSVTTTDGAAPATTGGVTTTTNLLTPITGTGL